MSVVKFFLFLSISLEDINYALLWAVLSAAGGIKVSSPGMKNGTVIFLGTKCFYFLNVVPCLCTSLSHYC